MLKKKRRVKYLTAHGGSDGLSGNAGMPAFSKATWNQAMHYITINKGNQSTKQLDVANFERIEPTSVTNLSFGWLNLHLNPNLHLWVFRKYYTWMGNEIVTSNDQVHIKKKENNSLMYYSLDNLASLVSQEGIQLL